MARTVWKERLANHFKEVDTVEGKTHPCLVDFKQIQYINDNKYKTRHEYHTNLKQHNLSIISRQPRIKT